MSPPCSRPEDRILHSAVATIGRASTPPRRHRTSIRAGIIAHAPLLLPREAACILPCKPDLRVLPIRLNLIRADIAIHPEPLSTVPLVSAPFQVVLLSLQSLRGRLPCVPLRLR